MRNNIARLPVLRGVLRRLSIFQSAFRLYIPPGHYYSPIVSQKEVKHEFDRIFNKNTDLDGVALNTERQLANLESFKVYYQDFVNDYDRPSPGSVYTPQNGFYGYTDGIFLYAFIRHVKPSQIIEVGSGYSSSLMYDVNKKYLNGSARLTFIEPYPDDRFTRIFANQRQNYQIIAAKVQQVDIEKFLELSEGDMLFIDSSHVSKTGSDLNFLLFSVLPKLKKGVLVHFHDIFYPFEYPSDHVLGNRWFSWNEAYMLHAFLMHNSEYEIVFWNSFLEKLKPDVFRAHFPHYYKGGSASIWIRKL